MSSKLSSNSAAQNSDVWTIADWDRLERKTTGRALGEGSEENAWGVIARQARVVMRTYSTSFFIVSRFLPSRKRDQVEAIYAAVRYPDEVVDTFPLEPSARLRLLDRWAGWYEEGLTAPTLGVALEKGVPCFLASFTRVVRERGIPPRYYRAFLDAMRRDVAPRPFETLDDLIDNYIYGSAIVVGYFLAYVYGSRTEDDFQRALKSARDLGIALQLTNFLRDVYEDQRRGRVYLPLDMLREHGIDELDAGDSRQHGALSLALRSLASVAASYYASAHGGLEAFAPDCRSAIHACIKVYGRLNERIASNESAIRHRESVPLREKLRVLPPSKYWRIPLAFLIR